MFYAIEVDGKVKSVMAAKPPEGSLGRIPVGISKDDYEYLQSTPSTDTFGNPINVISVDAAAKTAGEAEKQKAVDLQTAYDTMVEDVYNELYEVFRTRKPETATAEYETWRDMLESPAAYVPAGLKCDHQLNDSGGTEIFSPGSALDTAQKITDYATRKIEQAKAYGVYRAQRKQQYRDQKTALEG